MRIDLRLGTASGRFQTQPRLRLRVLEALTRMQLASCLPAATRCATVADAVASLWLPAGPQLGADQVRRLVSGAAAGLRGRAKKRGQAQNRSRPMELALYPPGLHRSHAGANAVYSMAGLLLRTLPVVQARWAQLWPLRDALRTGPMAALRDASAALGLSWDSPFSWSVPDVPDSTWDVIAERGSPPTLAKHRLRRLLRTAVARGEAHRRPKDFAGLEQGLARDRFFREAAATSHAPSLLSAGQWTCGRLWLAGLVPSANCPRCGAGAFETRRHRLWDCARNCGPRERLNRALSSMGLAAYVPLLPDILPPCLARCGLRPRTQPGLPDGSVALVAPPPAEEAARDLPGEAGFRSPARAPRATASPPHAAPPSSTPGAPPCHLQRDEAAPLSRTFAHPERALCTLDAWRRLPEVAPGVAGLLPRHAVVAVQSYLLEVTRDATWHLARRTTTTTTAAAGVPLVGHPAPRPPAVRDG
jgi:hypothetical protein